MKTAIYIVSSLKGYSLSSRIAEDQMDLSYHDYTFMSSKINLDLYTTRSINNLSKHSTIR
jgi:hypothetical protein